ncbi:MAG: hypothetical protein ACJ790_10045 [Myxococcaceae bacterium]
MRFLLIPVGFFLGALIARSFFLDLIEEGVFRAGWESAKHIHVGYDELRFALKTDTGQKIFAGAIIGTAGGAISAWLMGKVAPRRAK